MDNQTVTLDIRPVPVREKHPTIFRTFDQMDPGKTLLLINDHDPKPLYYQFTAERAGHFEWNYVERGPQVWRVEIAKKAGCGCGRRSFEKATDALREDHRVIEGVLDVLEQLVRTPAVPFETWEKAVDFIRAFADRCHHLKEEKILFPALEERGIPREGGPIGMMLFEHEVGRGYVKDMVESLEFAKEDPQAATPALIENAAAYLRLLRQHILKEDEVLFAMADDSLSPKEQQELLRAFAEHEAKEMGPGTHEKYLKIATELQNYGS